MEKGVIDVQVTRLHRLDGDGKVKAFADVTIAGSMIVRGLRIVEGKHGLFVGMPRQQGKNGQWYNIAYPTSKEAGQCISATVIEAFQS